MTRAFLFGWAVLAGATALACSEESSNGSGPTTAGPGVGGMDPDLGVRLGPGEPRQGPAVVVEGVKGRQDATLAELEREAG